MKWKAPVMQYTSHHTEREMSMVEERSIIAGGLERMGEFFEKKKM